MARKPTPLHKLKLRERRGQACCWYRSHDWPFGPWDFEKGQPSVEALAAFHTQLARWAVDPAAGVGADAPTVAEVLADWLESDDSPPAGRPLEMAREAVLWVCRRFAATPAERFGAADLEAWQAWMCEQLGPRSGRRYRRSTLLRFRSYLVRAWWWASRHRGIPESRPPAMEKVPSPKRALPDTRRKPMHVGDVAASLRHMPAGPADAVRILYRTGARIEELLDLRARDVVRTGTVETPSGARLRLDQFGVWAAVIVEHKTDGVNDRVILFGPRCQRVLAPILARKRPDEFLFDPREGMEAGRAKLRAKRKGRGSRKVIKGDKGKRLPGECYTLSGFFRAVQRAAKAAEVPHWYPRRLRNTAGHKVIQAGFGKDAARAYLGHSDHDTTARYTGKDLVTAAKVAVAIG